ncbi:hypothetical protein Dsin_008721 [Dipteronia sinensis]|uniref:DUF4283 domain-containing protein n=1 Tax=Dipteronia sinensis TaxID=43782 RepID=A0AAE0AP48_9ROSI|nr:hypothetical protein Dsin_008721 [Dipteronia sinensis]
MEHFQSVWESERPVFVSYNQVSSQLFCFCSLCYREEAEKVVKQTNGMHVYGWPIVSKIASSDWNNRRQSQDGKDIVDRMDRMEIMKWDLNSFDSSWLNVCAVGVLMSFNDITPVLWGLCERRINASFVYIGDKNILCKFTSISDRDTFIRSRMVWKEYFSSVGVWTEAITPQSRLSWIEFRGIPLQCWCDEFFRSLGWMVGEPLMVEEETANRTKLDCGRVLVLIPTGQNCPSFIKVVTEKSSFTIKVWEDTDRINSDWISKRLGIGKEKLSESPPIDRGYVVDVQGVKEDEGVDNINARVMAANKERTNQNSEDIESRGIDAAQDDNVLTIRGNEDMRGTNVVGYVEKHKVAGVGSKRVLFKGKEKRSQKCQVGLNGNVILDKNRVPEGGKVWTSDDCGSSNFEESEEGQFMKQPILLASPSRPSGDRSPEAHRKLLQVKAQSLLKKNQNQEALSEDQNSSSGNSVSQILETPHQQTDMVKENRIMSTDKERKKIPSKRTTKSCSSLKSHSMKTRKDMSQLARGVQEIIKEVSEPSCSRGRWNLEAEMAKVLEKGAALGYFKQPFHEQNSGTGTSVDGQLMVGKRILSEEVVKVIEIGTALGLDFHGQEDLVAEEINRKEKEEELRINEAR